MDVDLPENTLQDAASSLQNAQPYPQTEEKKSVIVVDEAHPFDVESYISGYSDKNAIYRLLYVLEFCPMLADKVFPLLEKHLKAGRDIGLYNFAVKLYNHAGAGEQVEMDQAWLAATEKANTNERNKLEVELKTYMANSIKESIRLGHRDLGQFYRAIGEDGNALKSYVKARENCSPALGQAMLDICISLLEILIEQRNYPSLPTYTFKAETALDAATASISGSSTKQQLAHKRTGPAPSEERARYQIKIDVATGLSLLGLGSYEKAATTFLKIGAPSQLESWNGKIITPSDIAIYGTLCALATLSRGAITAQLLQSETFSIYLEHEPYIRQLVTAYMANKFKTVLDLLERYSPRHQLDIHLAPHIHNLRNLIRDKALVLYFQPFQTVNLDRMASAFGMHLSELETLIVSLIRSGIIKGRIDSRNKILKANVVDQRLALFNRAVQAGAHIQSSNRKLLLRMRLQQADLVVRAPKNQNQNQQQMQPGATIEQTMAPPVFA